MIPARRGASSRAGARDCPAIAKARAWFEHLRALPAPAEVNFWAPSARSFRALQPGELFLFKLHTPDDFIVGGGIFAHADDLPCSLAWETYGDVNGAASFEEMRARIVRYSRPILANESTSPNLSPGIAVCSYGDSPSSA